MCVHPVARDCRVPVSCLFAVGGPQIRGRRVWAISQKQGECNIRPSERSNRRLRFRRSDAQGDGAHIVDFFTSFDWWKAEPRDELVTNGAFCLAEPGKAYAVYLPQGGTVTVKLAPGSYRAAWFNPRSGNRIMLPAAEGPTWISPKAPDAGDWALLMRR